MNTINANSIHPFDQITSRSNKLTRSQNDCVTNEYSNANPIYLFDSFLRRTTMLNLIEYITCEMNTIIKIIFISFNHFKSKQESSFSRKRSHDQ